MASALSKQIHSIMIGKIENGRWASNLKNTWDDYHLVPSSRPVVNPPEVRTMYVDVPGVDGAIDLTTALTGAVLYKNREGSWDFVVANDYEDWTAIYHKLMNEIHGKAFDVALEDEPNYYYKGRLSVNEWKSERNWSKITLDYHFQPYKFEFHTANEPWLWDPFNFETGIIRNYGAPTRIEEGGKVVIEPLTVDGENSLVVDLYPTERPIPFVINVLEGSTDMTVKIDSYNSAKMLEVGTNYLTTMLSQDPNYTGNPYMGNSLRKLTFSGTGQVWIKFQGAWL